MTECVGLEVGIRVEIVAARHGFSSFVGMQGAVERLTKPYWLARVQLDNYPRLVTFWVEELRIVKEKA